MPLLILGGGRVGYRDDVRPDVLVELPQPDSGTLLRANPSHRVADHTRLLAPAYTSHFGSMDLRYED